MKTKIFFIFLLALTLPSASAMDSENFELDSVVERPMESVDSNYSVKSYLGPSGIFEGDYFLFANIAFYGSIYPFMDSISSAANADLNGPYIGDEGSAITFDASASDGLQYRWDFENDGNWTDWSENATENYTWYDDHTGIVKVEVKYDNSTDTDTADVTINNVAPIVDAGEDRTVTEGETILFSGNFTDPGEDTHTITWDFGDGNNATGTLTPQHTYSDDGNYTVTLTIEDDDGGIGNDTLTVTVQASSTEEAVEEINDTIQDLPEDSFKNNADKRKHALSEKLEEVNELIEAGEYQEAINKLQKDIRAKADGQVDGNPRNDWINDPEKQQEICAMIDELVEQLKTFL